MSDSGGVRGEHGPERAADENGFSGWTRMPDNAECLLGEVLDLTKLGATGRAVLTWIRQCEDSNAVGNVTRKESFLVGREAPVLSRKEDNAADLRSAIAPNEHDVARPSGYSVRDVLGRTAGGGDVGKENSANLEVQNIRRRAEVQRNKGEDQKERGTQLHDEA